MSRYDTFSHEAVPRCCVYVLVFTVPVHAFLALLSSSFYRLCCFFLVRTTTFEVVLHQKSTSLLLLLDDTFQHF